MAARKRKPGSRAPSVWECSHVSEIAPHRQARLEEERARLERRLAWAEKRGEAAKVERLEEQLAALDDDLSLAPEELEGRGRTTDLRRKFGDEMCDAFGW